MTVSDTTPATAGDGTSLPAILQAADEARALRPTVRLALATLVHVEGSSYRQPGARLLIDGDERVLAGAISGGCLEGDVAARARDVLASDTPQLLRYDLREDLESIWGFGAACDGIAHVLLEPLDNDAWLRDAVRAMHSRSEPVLLTPFAHDELHGAVGAHRLLSRAEADALHVEAARVLTEPLHAPVMLHLIGGGRSAEAFATIACAMGWLVTIIDHREAMLAETRVPPSARKLRRRASEGLDGLPLDQRTMVAVLTHIFEVDLAWLEAILPAPVAYVGVLGSRSRAARLVQQLEANGLPVTSDMRARLYAPIGLDLGGESPESIALAGIAEMEAVLHDRPGGFLRARQSPIHTRTPVPLAAPSSVDVTIDGCALPVE